MRPPLPPAASRPNTEHSKRGARAAARFALPALLLLAAVLPAASAKKLVPSNTPAPSAAKSAAPRLFVSPLAAPALFQTTAPVPLTLATFAADCTTAKSDWNLGETVCVKIDGVTNASRVQLVNPSGYAFARADVGLGASSVTFTLPSAATLTSDDQTFDNRGTWHVSLVDASDAGTRLTAPIKVHELGRQVANVQVVKVLNSGQAVAGSNIVASVRVYNAGPDAAENVTFTDVPPPNAAFLSLAQTGPSFACTTPAAGGLGTSTCTIASLAADTATDFTITYLLSTGVADAAALTSSASATTTTTETAANDNGSSDSATSDNPTPPSCTVSYANVTVTAAQGQNGANVTFPTPTVTGTCGTITTNPADGSFFPIGTTTVSVATQSGQSGSFFVTVNPYVDTTAPSIACPPDVTTDESSSSANSAAVSYPAPSASDDSGTVTVDCSPASGSSFPVGTTEVRCTATDPSGNSSSCSFSVTVNEVACSVDANSAAPTPNVASLPTITRSCSATLLAADDPTATDACGGTISGETTSARYYEVPGSYTVVWTYTDGAGHTTTQNQTVVILPDNSAPVPDAATLPTVTGECFAAITGDAPTATDNCAGSGIEGVALDPLSYNTAGTHVVRWKFTDPAGNSTIQTQNVVVTDTHPPTVTLNGPSSVTVECHTSYADPGASATDNCGAAPTITSSGFDVNTPGTYVVTYTATDGGGNTASVQRTVTVVDTTPPTVTLNGAAAMTVECHTSFSDPGASAADSCAGDLTSQIARTGSVDVNTPGTYTLTYAVSDPSGKAASATRTVTVVDSTKPVITLNGPAALDVFLGSTYADAGATATDSCAGSVAVTATSTVNTAAVGTYAVTYTATDPSGNQAVPVVRTVRVIYNFTGFFSPISNTAVNVVNAGRSVPVKFNLAGNQGLGIFPLGSPTSVQVSCTTANTIDVEGTVTSGGSSLTYDASSGQYIYNWKTDGSWAGQCRVLNVTLADGTTHTAYFKFK